MEEPDLSRQVAPTAIHIHGTKRVGRDRLVPYILDPVLPGLLVRPFTRIFKQACPSHTPYDLRRAYGRLLEDAGVPRSRIEAYLGHGVRAVTDLYLRHEVLPFLDRDAQAVRKLFPKRVLKARLA